MSNLPKQPQQERIPEPTFEQALANLKEALINYNNKQGKYDVDQALYKLMVTKALLQAAVQQEKKSNSTVEVFCDLFKQTFENLERRPVPAEFKALQNAANDIK